VHNDERIERFYTSKAWRKCRITILANAGGLCQNCLKKGLVEPAVEVHHVKPLTPDNIDDPRITLDESNLIALCAACHDEMHRTKRWRCDALGHITL